MSNPVSIPRQHFQGTGKHPWLIAGRVPGDDDDSSCLILADDEDAAQKAFVEALHNDADIDEEDRAHLIDNFGADYFITSTTMLV